MSTQGDHMAVSHECAQRGAASRDVSLIRISACSGAESVVVLNTVKTAVSPTAVQTPWMSRPRTPVIVPLRTNSPDAWLLRRPAQAHSTDRIGAVNTDWKQDSRSAVTWQRFGRTHGLH